MKALAARDAELDLIRKVANAEVEIGVALSEDVTETVEAVCGLLDRLNEGDSKTEVPRRRKLPNRRRGYTQKVKINGESVFLRVSEYEDGAVGEIFVNMYKQGAGFGAMLNAFCVAISVGLQYGVPLEKFVDLFIYSRFQPDGFVAGHDQINRCSSAIDFIFQDLALTFLGDDAIKKRPSTSPIDSE
jgi:ribonucleoside-diphosphate reductase alpha chain